MGSTPYRQRRIDGAVPSAPFQLTSTDAIDRSPELLLEPRHEPVAGEAHDEAEHEIPRDAPDRAMLMLPWAEERVKENQTTLHKNDPMVACLPPGVPRANLGGTRGMPHPFKVVQTPTLVVFLYETSTNQTFRQVFLDGRPHPTDPQPTWLGYSIGRWEGDTLVVETTGFNGRAWVDTGSGHPQTDAAHVTERFTRRNIGNMDIDITIDDPKAYMKPWTARVPVNLLPDSDLIETFCENEKDLGRMFREPVKPQP